MGERAIDRPIDEIGIAQEAIREELFRILESPTFAQSDRLGRFLRYTVETTLAGDAKILKEYLIGTEVYERRPPYSPTSDSIVRSEARRLRRKLKEYYESNGKDDPVFIYYRPGSYVPVFRRCESQKNTALATERVLRELLTDETVAKAIEFSSLSRDTNLQIVFEGTIRIFHSKRESAKPGDSELWSKRAKGVPLKKVVGMSSTKCRLD